MSKVKRALTLVASAEPDVPDHRATFGQSSAARCVVLLYELALSGINRARVEPSSALIEAFQVIRADGTSIAIALAGPADESATPEGLAAWMRASTGGDRSETPADGPMRRLSAMTQIASWEQADKGSAADTAAGFLERVRALFARGADPSEAAQEMGMPLPALTAQLAPHAATLLPALRPGASSQRWRALLGEPPKRAPSAGGSPPRAPGNLDTADMFASLAKRPPRAAASSMTDETHEFNFAQENGEAND